MTSDIRSQSDLSGTQQSSTAAASEHHRKKSRRKKRRFYGFPAPFVFWSTGLLGLLGAAVVQVVGLWATPAAALACLWIIMVLRINDGKGFIRRKQMRRAFEARRHFNGGEVVVLFLLILLNLFVSVTAFF